jgi:cob(I)alamin adenosyltransferase
MKRIVSTVLIVSFLALTGILAAAPFLDGTVAYAEVSDDQIKDEISKIKKMIADLEKQLATPRKMSATGMEKTMKMLKDVSKTLDDLFREAPYRAE